MISFIGKLKKCFHSQRASGNKVAPYHSLSPLKKKTDPPLSGSFSFVFVGVDGGGGIGARAFGGTASGARHSDFPAGIDRDHRIAPGLTRETAKVDSLRWTMRFVYVVLLVY